MPQFIPTSKTDFAFKFGLGIFHTNSTWNWFAELYKNEVNVLLNRIWADPLFHAANFAEGDQNAIDYAQITKETVRLTLEPSHNNRLWRARDIPGDVNSNVIIDGISPLDVPDGAGQPSDGYTVRLYQDDGAGGVGPEISTTSGAWVWHYKINALLLDEGHTAADEGWTEPLYVTFYRYSGAFGASGSGSSTFVSPEGILFFVDSTRGKNLSAERISFNFGINHVKARGKRFLYAAGGSPSNTSAFFIPRDATITAITAHADNDVSGVIQIEKVVSGTPINIHTSTLTIQDSRFDDDLNIDLDGGDRIRVYIESGQWDYPAVQVELAWRF